MKLSRLLVLLLLLAPMAALGQFRSTDLENPRPIGIPDGVSQAEVKEAVIDAMYARGWAVGEESDDHVVADLFIRSHYASVDIAIGADEIVITYRDSDNLNYAEKDGRTLIHKNYISWVDNLSNDIRRNLARARRG